MGYMDQPSPIMPDNYTPELWNASSSDFKSTQNTKNTYNANGYTSSDLWNTNNDTYKPRNNTNTENNNGYYWGKNQKAPQANRQYNSDVTKSSSDNYYGAQDSPDLNHLSRKRPNQEDSEEELVDQVIETSNGNVFNLSSQQNHQMKYDFKKEKPDVPGDGGKTIKTESSTNGNDMDHEGNLANGLDAGMERTPDANYWTQFMVEYDRALTDSSSKSAPNRPEDMYVHSQGEDAQVNGSKLSYSQDRINNNSNQEKEYSNTIGAKSDNINSSLYSMFDYPNMESAEDKEADYSSRKRQKEDAYSNLQAPTDDNTKTSYAKNNDITNKGFGGGLSSNQDVSNSSLYQYYNYSSMKDLGVQQGSDSTSSISSTSSFADRTAKASFMNYKDIKIENKIFPDSEISKSDDTSKSLYKSFDYSNLENGSESDNKYLQRIRQLEEENGVLESKLKEMKQFCNTLSDDYNEKLGLAKNQMESWLNMWNDVEKTLKDENNKHVGEISQLKEIIETLQKDNSKLSEVNNFLSQGNVDSERKKSGTPESDSALSGRYKEIVQKKTAEISQLKLVNERLAKDNEMLSQKGKGADEHMANKAKLETSLQDARKGEEAHKKRVFDLEAQLREKAKDGANKLQLMVLKEKNKIQDVKLKEFQTLIQNQDFKINVLSSKLAIYKHRNDKINNKDDGNSNEADNDFSSNTQNGLYFKTPNSASDERPASKFRSVTEFIDIDCDVE